MNLNFGPGQEVNKGKLYQRASREPARISQLDGILRRE